jgi:hypothetical protein
MTIHTDPFHKRRLRFWKVTKLEFWLGFQSPKGDLFFKGLVGIISAAVFAPVFSSIFFLWTDGFKLINSFWRSPDLSALHDQTKNFHFTNSRLRVASKWACFFWFGKALPAYRQPEMNPDFTILTDIPTMDRISFIRTVNSFSDSFIPFCDSKFYLFHLPWGQAGYLYAEVCRHEIDKAKIRTIPRTVELIMRR